MYYLLLVHTYTVLKFNTMALRPAHSAQVNSTEAAMHGLKTNIQY